MSQQLYERGALYKAVTETDLRKLEVDQIEGLKLHVFQQQLKPLREMQKALRPRFGKKPDLKFVLNAILATGSFDSEVVGEWIVNLYSSNRQANSESDKPKSLVDLLREQHTDQD
jgi:hypothetical protein